MKKTLVAIAALAAATGAMAQSSVTAYGLLDTGYYQYKSTGVEDVKLNAVGNINSANGSGYLGGSRLGFKGMEDLGGGMSAEFQLEYGVNMTTAESTATTGTGTSYGDAQGLANMRLGTVALNGGFGQVKIGTQYSYIDPASGSAGSQQANPTGGTNAAQGAASLLKFNEAKIARATNSISYTTPNISGFTGQLLLNPSEVPQGTTAQAGSSSTAYAGAQATVKNEARTEYALNYAQGPLKAGYVNLKIKDYAGFTSTAGVAIGLVGTKNDAQLGMTAGATSAADLTYTVAGASYDFGSFKLSGTNTTFKAEAKDGSSYVKSNQTGFAVSVPVGKWDIGGGYTTGMLSNGTADVFKTKGIDLLAVYNLSKRTSVYGVYGMTKYDTQNATAVTNDVNTTVNLKQTAIGAGLRHSF